MNGIGQKSRLRRLVVGFFLAFVLSVPMVFGAEAFAVEEEEVKVKSPAIDRWAFKTNAFEWLLTVPNFGVEFDLVNSPYNKCSIGLTAKYNWNTTHMYAPPTVFNLLDVRPEFRYYYRTYQKGDKLVDDDGKKIKYGLFARKNPKPWRAYYTGAYVDYGSYTFKFGKTGHQGYTIGLGAVMGYGLPLYQYNKGVIDLELGLAFGLQVATHDRFEHNPDGYFYTKLEERSKGLHFTPFPVLSELRVAFVWRHKSIKDKVQEDEEKKKMDERIERARKQITEPFIDAKAKFDEQLGWTMDESDIVKLKANTEAYQASFTQYINDEATRLRESTIPNFKIDDKMKEKLSLEMDKYIAEAHKQFNKELGLPTKGAKKPAKAETKPAKEDQKAEKVKEPKKEKAEKEKVEKPKKAKEEKAKPEKAPNEEKVKKEKAPKEENVKEEKAKKEKEPKKSKEKKNEE